ncbi:Hsp20/alpha crystallin family protein [Fictibacillus terranigra]|uniref:Hsp20/alpha crystallin family protein n=1 Tax=Fictibacillus terranigra TaxID=3058424 RepID=A0ABT8EB92_9BACL|nr:Hsp20/alpha crystallin family protein [Fictibacillus sp. CENA-BCM004]MDN4075191.1 Hsp20/alpha crystallin family protein [Fictibacillus sp. CENA-BCM004]
MPENGGPIMPFFNEKSIGSWVKSLEQFIDKSFEHYQTMVDHLSFPLDVQETKNEFIAHANLENYDQSQIQIEVLDRALKIIAYASESNRFTDDKTNISQFKQANKRVERLVPLPFAVKQEDVRATFGNGLLKIRVKKSRPSANYIDIKPEAEE